MSKKNEYLIDKDGQLLKNGTAIGITVIDDYFYKNKKFLDIYIEDGRLFHLVRIIPFVNWFKSSRPLNLDLDKSGKIIPRKDASNFDEILARAIEK